MTRHPDTTTVTLEGRTWTVSQLERDIRAARKRMESMAQHILDLQAEVTVEQTRTSTLTAALLPTFWEANDIPGRRARREALDRLIEAWGQPAYDIVQMEAEYRYDWQVECIEGAREERQR